MPGSEQYRWLEGELQKFAGKTWKFVFFHEPLYSSGVHGPDLALRDALHPLFVRYGVDLVFTGHDHDYERSAADGVTYIVTGGFGAPLYDQFRYSPYSKYFASVHHFCVVDVSGASLTVTVTDGSGGTVEKFSLRAR